MKQFDAVDIIRAKREGHKLSLDEINWTIDAYTKGAMGDEQMAALAMAIFLNGMDREEISQWTTAMINSGERMDFSSLGKPTADKHSTGGVGDKITLPLAPLVAVYGVAVPQLSGRGLGHTGGTLDKLEAIPGWQADLTNDEIMHRLGKGSGAVICAAGAGLAPADKKLYGAARRHCHCGYHPADRVLDHVQEDCGGYRFARARRQGRIWRVHEAHRAGTRTRAHDGRSRLGRWRADHGTPDGHVHPAWSEDR